MPTAASTHKLALLRELRNSVELPVEPSRDACCHEKVAFWDIPEVICTVDAAVSVQLVAVRPFFQTVQNVANSMRGVTLTRLATGSEKPLWRGTLIASLNNRP